MSGQVFALVTDSGGVANGVERIEEPPYPLVGGVNIVVRDVIPDAIEVAVGIFAQNILRHALGLPALLRLALEPGAGIRRRNVSALVKHLETASKFLVEPGKLNGARMVVLLKQSERLSNYFASGVVTARFHLGTDKFLKLLGK